MWVSKPRVLVLAPHTDDAEFGCGGFIARLLEARSSVYCVAFSSADKSLPPKYPAGTLRKEIAEATQILGIAKENLILFDYPVRDFPLHRQKLLEDMIRLKQDLHPDLVLQPSTHDTHQDHQTVADEGFRAFKDVSLLGYEVPWNNLTFSTNAFVALEERHLQKKIEAIRCYESQRERPYASEEFIRSLARTRGTQIGTRYAEVFESIRWVIRTMD